MNEDTPLEKVAAILPIDSAKLLTDVNSDVQVYILKQMRAVICYWESIDIELDPLVFEAVLDAMVGTLTPLAETIQRLTWQLLGVDETHVAPPEDN